MVIHGEKAHVCWPINFQDGRSENSQQLLLFLPGDLMEPWVWPVSVPPHTGKVAFHVNLNPLWAEKNKMLFLENVMVSK